MLDLFLFPLIIKPENKELNTTQMCRCVVYMRVTAPLLLLLSRGMGHDKKMPYCCSSLSNSGASLCDRVISQPVALSTATTNTDSLVAQLSACVCVFQMDSRGFGWFHLSSFVCTV